MKTLRKLFPAALALAVVLSAFSLFAFAGSQELVGDNIAGDCWSAVDGKWGGPEQAGYVNGDMDSNPQVVHAYEDGMLHVYSTRTDNGLSFSGNVIGIASLVKPDTEYKVEATIKYTANPESHPFYIRSNNNVSGSEPVIVAASDDFVTYTYTFKTGSTINATDYLMVGIWENNDDNIYGQMHFGTDIWVKSCVLTNLSGSDDPVVDQPDDTAAPADEPSGSDAPVAEPAPDAPASQTFDAVIVLSLALAASAGAVVASKKRK